MQVKDSDIDAVMKKTGATIFEAAEALEKYDFQPRKACKVDPLPTSSAI